MEKKCMIFGCGAVGKVAYNKLNQIYNILAYIDNNKELWGNSMNKTSIISPTDAKQIHDDNEDIVIIIAVVKYYDIFLQLKQMGISNIMVWKSGLLYHCNGQYNLIPVEEICIPYKKHNGERMSVLFVQTSPCIRTNKIAKSLKDNGIETSLAYMDNSPHFNNNIYAKAYMNYYAINSFQGLINYINNSDYDLIHSSNEPDILTALLSFSNKPVVHDCHDLSSAYKSMTPDEMAVEFIANVKSAGVIYTTEGIRNVALKKFGIRKEKTFVLENLISEELIPDRHLDKISASDGKMHIVYEGGIIGNDKMNHRFFETIWLKIASQGIHIHFYSPSDYSYCTYLEKLHPNLHFEGNLSSRELSVEMSKYDVGLCWLNTNDKNKQYLEFASPNKIQEYVNAGIPVAVGNVESQIDYVEGHGFGKYLDLNSDIKKELYEISNIKIPDKVLVEKELTFERRIPYLMEYYENIKEHSCNSEIMSIE